VPLPLPPHSVDAEQAVIGAVLIDAEAYDRVGDVLVAEDFYRQDHVVIWREIVRVYEAGSRPDIVTLAQHVDRAMDDNLLGYLGELAHHTPSSANVLAYAGMIVERRRERQLLAASQQIPGIVADRLTPFAERLDQAQALLLDVDRPTLRGPRSIGDVMRTVMDGIEARFERGGAMSGIPTGYQDLDRMLDGLHESELIIVAARPSVGKTALALDLTLSAARAGKGVLYCSLEMGADQLGDRALSSVGKIPHEQIRTGKLTDEAWPRLTSALTRLNELKLHIDDDAGMTLAALRARARRVDRETGGLGLIVVDYLQLMTPPKSENRTQEISALSRGLKLLAKDMRVPVIVLSQLNRDLERRANKRPMMSDLRESGAIEQDADVILMLYRPSVYGKREPGRPDFTEIIVAKQRNGPIGSVWLQYQGPYMTFVASERPSQHDLEPAADDMPVGFDW
jgi:replicative DNA helicase